MVFGRSAEGTEEWMDERGRYYSFEGENDEIEERTVRRRLAYCANDSLCAPSLPSSARRRSHMWMMWA